MICTPHQMLFWYFNQELDGQCMWHVWETGEVHTWFLCGDLMERYCQEDLGIDGSII